MSRTNSKGIEIGLLLELKLKTILNKKFMNRCSKLKDIKYVTELVGGAFHTESIITEGTRASLTLGTMAHKLPVPLDAIKGVRTFLEEKQ